MRIFVVCGPTGVPLAPYSDKREADAKWLAGRIGGAVVGPMTINRDIPHDATGFYEVELTRDGAVKRTHTRELVDVLLAEAAGEPLAPGWEVVQTPSRWRLKVRAWAKGLAVVQALAQQIYADIHSGRRQKYGVL